VNVHGAFAFTQPEKPGKSGHVVFLGQNVFSPLSREKAEPVQFRHGDNLMANASIYAVIRQKKWRALLRYRSPYYLGALVFQIDYRQKTRPS